MSDKEDEVTIADEAVLAKYKLAAEIVNRVLLHLVKKCVAGASIRDICIEGDELIGQETKNVCKKDKDMKRGIAFPVCISVNNCINHYSPLISDPDTILQDGDLVKIDFGAHLDGFIAVVGHTLVVGASKENKIKGRKADVMLASHWAAEAALRLIKAGNENYAVTDAVKQVSEVYNCKPIEGMLSFQLQQNKIDGEKTIIQNPSETHRKEVEKVVFEKFEVYGVDVIISTGEGIGREMDARVTVFRKTEEIYSLKLKASREIFSKIQKNCGSMPFTLRGFDDEKKAKLGVVECVNHKLLDPYPVLWEKEGEYVAQFKFTVLILQNGPSKITGLPFDVGAYESEYKIEDEDILKLLATEVGSKKKKSRNVAASAVESH